MAGKGQRRREKNFRAAHSGYSPLPLPPRRSDLHAVPTKLRRIMKFKDCAAKQGPVVISRDKVRNRRRQDAPDESEETRYAHVHLHAKSGDGCNNGAGMLELEQDVDMYAVVDSKEKRKHKKKEFGKLQIQSRSTDGGVICSKRREHRKQYSKDRKKKLKKSGGVENREFPGHERIRFGEVVDAPPKLNFGKVAFLSAVYFRSGSWIGGSQLAEPYSGVRKFSTGSK